MIHFESENELKDKELCTNNVLQMLDHFAQQGNVFTTFKRCSYKRRKTDQDHVWLNFVLLLSKFISKGAFSTAMQRFQCLIKTYNCRYKIAVFSLSILMLNDSEIRTTYFYVFFPFVNLFTNDMIKTPIVSLSLKNIKIRNEFIKRISLLAQKLIIILFWSSFFWYTQYILNLKCFNSRYLSYGKLILIISQTTKNWSSMGDVFVSVLTVFL